MKELNYEIWAVGYDGTNNEVVDLAVFLGMATTSEEAIAHAKKFYDLGCIFGDKVSEELYEGEYVKVTIDKRIEVEGDEPKYETIWTNILRQEA